MDALDVGRNKPVRVTARTGVSGKYPPNSPETPPHATRLDGLIPAYIRVRHSSVHIEMTLFDRLVYKDESRSLGTRVMFGVV
ncbi:hypothetical protein Mettu_2061 [Methylobacter tundripaludum SV96]|uniref:Uncharacterized protein n=1 Tax=Methylobacter tundripaludum (strain ATCC BAA-1195 / DSM 17260 / SV96) TaxID=697282 RepID=G3IXF9_METTV|nr:hypothetical protein Mettu_2061 [Methylobacter tundripaludum SV96]